MLKKIILGLISFMSFSINAADVKDITQQSLLAMDKSNHVIIDVRTQQEYLEGHVPNAINIPLQKLQSDFQAAAFNKDKTLVLYCRSGYRAGKAAKILQDNGYSNLMHLDGDMLGWEKAALPIEK